MVVVYLKCCQGSTVRSRTGFQRYERLVQDENDLPVMTRQKNGRKNHVMASDSDDEDDQTLFSSNMKKSMIP